MTNLCMKCHDACSQCNGPINDNIQCTVCAPGYWSTTSSGPCSSCFSNCATCNGLTNTSCVSCAFTFFLYTVNNSCISTCPSTYYSS